MDTKPVSEAINELKSQGEAFFSAAFNDCGEELMPAWMLRDDGASTYWNQLSQEARALSQQAQETLLSAIMLLLPAIKASPVLDSSDEKDVGQCTKRMRASLRLRNYKSWNVEVLADEDVVLGVNPPGQSDDEPSAPSSAKEVFLNCVEQMEGMVQLLHISPSNIPNGIRKRTQTYRKHTGRTPRSL